MAFTISNAFVKTFEANVRHLAQQSESKLRGRCVEKSPGPGESHSFKTIGTATMALKSARGTAGRRADTPENDTAWANRVAIAATYDTGDTVEREDELKMLADPTSEIAKSFAMAARRTFDDVIIDAATAASLDEAGTSTDLPAAQLLSDGSAEITFDRITEINELFLKNDIDPEMPKFAVISPTMARKFMHEAKATSQDYVNSKQLVSGGFIRNWMGFDWIVSNRLNSLGAGRLTALFCTNQAMGLLVPEDVNCRIAEDPSKSFMWRIYQRMTIGAVRIEDKHVIAFDCKNTCTIS